MTTAGSSEHTPGFEDALSLFKDASKRVPAYKDFLAKAKIDPDKIQTESDFSHVPPTDKPNYISAYKLEDLSWDGVLTKTKYILQVPGQPEKLFTGREETFRMK